MKIILPLVLALAAISAPAQTELLATFRGTIYQTNGAGILVSNAISDQSMLQDVGQSAGIGDLKSIAVVYHVGGSGFGDTLDVVYTNNGAVVTTLFGFFFADNSNQNVGRTVLTNATLTEMRRLDYIYTSQSPYARGGGFVTRRYVFDRYGNVRPTMDGQIEWLVTAQTGSSAQMGAGSFTTGKPLF